MARNWMLICRTHLLISSICWSCHNVYTQVAASTISSNNCTVDTHCNNGGVCVRSKVENVETSLCQCKPGWSGEYCESQVLTPCRTNPCQNGGSCLILSENIVICQCDVYWTGVLCKTFKGFQDTPPISTSCSSSDYKCLDGSCVVGQSLCDGIKDCSDGSDEKECSSIKGNSKCPLWEYECEDGTCIPRYKCCDEYADCSKGEDELDCSEFEDPPISPAEPVPSNSDGLTSTNLIIITCSMLLAVVTITMLVYCRRLRNSQHRLYSPVSWTLNQHGDGISMPYHVSQHANFCHHLPPHRCPRTTNTNGLAGYPLSAAGSGSDQPDVLLATLELSSSSQGRGCASRADQSKENSDDENDVPPTYADVIRFDSEHRPGDETPPPSYEDL